MKSFQDETAITQRDPWLDSLTRAKHKSDVSDQEELAELIQKLSESNSWLSDNILWIVFGLLVVSIIVMIYIPTWVTREVRGDAVRLELQNKFRLTIAQAIGGLGLVLTFLTAFLNMRVTNDQFLLQSRIQALENRIERRQANFATISTVNQQIEESKLNAEALITTADKNSQALIMSSNSNYNAIVEAAEKNKDAQIRNSQSIEVNASKNYEAKELEINESTRKELFIKAIEYLHDGNPISRMSGLEILRDLSHDPDYEIRAGRIVNEFFLFNQKEFDYRKALLEWLGRQLPIKFVSRRNDLGVPYDFDAGDLENMPDKYLQWFKSDNLEDSRYKNILDYLVDSGSKFEWIRIGPSEFAHRRPVILQATPIVTQESLSSFLRALAMDRIPLGPMDFFPGNTWNSREIQVATEILEGMKTYKSIFKYSYLNNFPSEKISSIENSTFVTYEATSLIKVGLDNFIILNGRDLQNQETPILFALNLQAIFSDDNYAYFVMIN